MSHFNTTSNISFSEKAQIMQNELRKLNIYPDTVFTPEDFYELLDRRIGGRTFDRGIASQLYERMQKDPYSGTNVTGAEFIKVYLEAEEVLRSKIQQTEASINEYDKQKADVIDKLEVLKKEEVTNAYGIMNGSKLNVAIYDFQYITTPIPRYMFVTAACEQQTLRTQVAEYRNKAEWNEEFEIEISTGLDDLQLTVGGFNQQNESPIILGEVRISLSKLKDQQVHEEWFDLFDRNGHLVGGKIHLGLQWIFSRVKYLNDVARKWDDYIRMHWDDKVESEKDLKAIYELFPALLHSYPKSEAKKMSRPPPMYLSNLQKNVSPVKGDQEYQEAPSSQDVEIEWRDATLWGHLSIMGSIALLVLSLFACFMKADFLDITICVAFLSHCVSSGAFKGSPDRVYSFFIAIVAAIALDILWLIFYGRTWGQVARGFEATPNLSNFVIVIKYFSLGIKLFVALGYFKFSKVLRDAQGRVANIQLHPSRFSTTQMKNY